MEFSASEFVERIKKGEEVTGARIKGQVVIGPGTEVRQQDWSDCRFDSSIEIRYCVFPPNHTTGKAVLDLSEAKIDGRIHLYGASAGTVNPAANEMDLLLSGADVSGELLVVAEDAGPSLSVNFCSAVFSGQAVFRGKFKRINGQDSTIGARLGIHLKPVQVWDEIDHERRTDDCDAANQVMSSVLVNISRAVVSGDVEIIPDDKGVLEVYERFSEEGGVPSDVDILVLLDAERSRVEGDFLVGIPQSDYSEASKWPAILTHGINLRRAEVSGEMVLRCVEVVHVEPLEENSNLYVGIASRGLRCGGLSLNQLDFNIEINENSGINQGELVRLVELDDAKVQGKASLFHVKGVVEAVPESWSGPNVDGISIARMECESLDLSASAIVYVDAGSASLLPIEADGVRVLGTAELDLRAKMDGWWSKDYEDAVVGKIQHAIGAELIPEASAQGANIGNLELVADPPVKEKLDLTGAQVRKWKIGSGGQEEETAENYLALLQATKGLDVGLYLAIEKRLEDIGKRRDADRVHVAWQRRRRKESLYLQSKPRWLLSLLHDVALGYGTKTWRPAIVILAAFVVSVLLVFAHHPRWVQVSAQTLGEFASCGMPCADRADALLGEKGAGRRALDAVALSAKNLIPVIDLQVAHGLEPVPGSHGSYWLLLLRLIGIVAWPVLLAGSLAQVIHKRNLG